MIETKHKITRYNPLTFEQRGALDVIKGALYWLHCDAKAPHSRKWKLDKGDSDAIEMLRDHRDALTDHWHKGTPLKNGGTY